jgi:hypothetical protein
MKNRSQQEFSLLHVVQTGGSGAHPASYPIRLGVKRPERETDHSPPASAKVKKMWIYTSTPPYAFMVLCNRDNFTLPFTDEKHIFLSD